MKVGEPKREWYIEPVELPEPLRPAAAPEEKPSVEQPEEVPAEEPRGA